MNIRPPHDRFNPRYWSEPTGEVIQRTDNSFGWFDLPPVRTHFAERENGSDDDLSSVNSDDGSDVWAQDRWNRDHFFSTRGIRVDYYRTNRLPHSPANPRISFSGWNELREPRKVEEVMRNGQPDVAERERHAWNNEDRSLATNLLSNDRFTFHRHPFTGTTDAVRGKIGYSRGFHVWSIKWPQTQRGTTAVIGVATKKCLLHSIKNTNLVGGTEEGYGWDIVQQVCHHNSDNTKTWNYPVGENQPQHIPNTIYCYLDMDEGYLAFATREKFLGVAFRNLKGKTLYPIAASGWGHSLVTIDYFGSLDGEPLSLTSLSARQVRQTMGPEFHERVGSLSAPPVIQKIIVDEF